MRSGRKQIASVSAFGTPPFGRMIDKQLGPVVDAAVRQSEQPCDPCRNFAVVFHPTSPGREPDQKRRNVGVVRLLPKLTEMGDLPRTAGHYSRGGGLRQ